MPASCEAAGRAAMEAEAALVPKRASAPDEWRSIDTAPRDGTRVLVFDPIHGQRAAMLLTSFEDRDEQWVYARILGSDAIAFICHPTHWQPLPEPPAAIARTLAP